MKSYIQSALQDANRSLQLLIKNHEVIQTIEQSSKLMVSTLQQGGRIYSCGNGGSMCDAMHFAEELSGKFRRERPALAAMAISDPAHLSCTANDFGYDQVFSRFIDGFGQKNDMLLAISTSGKSQNILNAVKSGRNRGMSIVALTGCQPSPLGQLAHVDICTPSVSPFSDRIQELHIKCLHILVELCERELFPSLYDKETIKKTL